MLLGLKLGWNGAVRWNAFHRFSPKNRSGWSGNGF